MATARIGRRRRHKRHKQRARQRRANRSFQTILRELYAPAAMATLRTEAGLVRALRFPNGLYVEDMPKATDRRLVELRRPVSFLIGDSNLGAL